MDSDGLLFSCKFIVLAFLVATIGLCATGLYPKTADKAGLTPEYLLEEQYDLEDELMYVMVSRERLKGIAGLNELQAYRETILNYAIGCLVCSGIVFGLAGMLSGIH